MRGRAAPSALALLRLLHLDQFSPPSFALPIRTCSWAEWRVVLLLSAPVVLVDEVLKLVSRR